MILNRRSILPGLLGLAATVPNAASASCGSVFCVINTQWDTQGMHAEACRFLADLRYEYIKQHQLRRGGRNITAAEDTSDATELKTLNRNLVASLDYTFDRHWEIFHNLT